MNEKLSLVHKMMSIQKSYRPLFEPILAFLVVHKIYIGVRKAFFYLSQKLLHAELILCWSFLMLTVSTTEKFSAPTTHILDPYHTYLYSDFASHVQHPCLLQSTIYSCHEIFDIVGLSQWATVHDIERNLHTAHFDRIPHNAYLLPIAGLFQCRSSLLKNTRM